MTGKTNAPSIFQVTSSALTHEGASHTVNEDAFLDRGEAGLWAVADGMGGHHYAKIASKVIIDSLKSLNISALRQRNSVDKIKEKIMEANSYLFALAQSQGSRVHIGSTIVILYFFGGFYHIMWAGDSRCYHHQSGKMKLLTKDHSYFEMQAQEGHRFTGFAKENQLSNILTRAVGVKNQLELDMITGPLIEDDIFWLCSDGGLKCLTENEVEGYINSYTQLSRINELILQTSLQRKVDDNITSLLIQPKSYCPP